jgi:hypothetical protein
MNTKPTSSNDQKKLKNIFGDAFQRYGPPTVVPDVDPSTYSILYDARVFFTDIYCDYIQTDELNAMACIHKGYELVAIFMGLINFVNPYYAAFLSDPLMFQEIGDPYRDKKAEQLNKMRIEYLRKYTTLGMAPLSVCPIRSHAIIRVIECCLLFLHAHEVAHIVLGHLDLLADEFGMKIYEELPIVPISAKESGLRKVLELQADQSAALTSLHLFRQQLQKSSTEEEFKNADLLWSIAVESLFVLLELAMIKKGIRLSITHPSPFVRWLNVKLNVYEQAEEHGIRPLQLPKTVPSPMQQVINWLTTNKLIEGSPLFSRHNADNAAEELFSTWEGIRPYEFQLDYFREMRGNRVRNRVES